MTHFLYLLTFIPVIAFSLLLWAAILNHPEYGKRPNILLLSIVTVTLTGAIQIPMQIFPDYVKGSANLPVFMFIALGYLIGFILLEYSVHAQRIQMSFLTEDVKEKMGTLRIFVLVLGGMAVFMMAFHLLGGASFLEMLRPGRESALRVYLTAQQGFTIIFIGLFIYTALFVNRIVFSSRAGVLRRNTITLITASVVVGAFILLFFAFGGFRGRVYFEIFLILNIIYVVRAFQDYFFQRIKNMGINYNNQETRYKRRHELTRRVINSPMDEDAEIIRNTIQDAWEKANESVVNQDQRFTGISLFLKQGTTLQMISREHFFGFCVPVIQGRSLKNKDKDALEDMIYKQTYDFEKLAHTNEASLRNLDEKCISQMIREKDRVFVPLDKEMKSFGKMIVMYPIVDADNFLGFLIVYKQFYDNIFPKEDTIIRDLTDNLSTIDLIMVGKGIQQERNRLQGEMDIARNIQVSVLPKEIKVEGYDCAGFMKTATEVGGDAYDFISTEFGNYFAIGDVSGHGLPAGMMAVIQQAAFHGALETAATMKQEVPIGTLYEVVNRVLCRINRDRIGSDKFMTLNYLVEKEGTFEHSGTHEVALIYRSATETVEEVHATTDKTGFLGLSEFILAGQSVNEFTLNSGDILYLYSDGVIEAKDQYEKQFGIDKTKEVILANHNATANDIALAIEEKVAVFAENGDLKKHKGKHADDITMLVIKKE